MSGQHTQGRLVVGEFTAFSCELIADGKSIAKVRYGIQSDAVAQQDARRLAACWNACEGLATEEIESLVDVGGWPGTFLCLEELIENHRVLRAERDQLRAELDAARTLLSEVMATVPADHFDPLVDRIRALLDKKGGPLALASVGDMANRLVDYAGAVGVVVTISQVPRLPLAMGNYDTVASVRPARGFY